MKVKFNQKCGSSAPQAMFQKFNSHVWLVATVQGGMDGNVSVNA